jgi:hypothetical protein
MAEKTLRARKVADEIEESRMTGLDELRKSAMMAHLLDGLERGTDIDHYGRLVFAMVARHFLDEEELLEWLKKDEDFSEARARSLILQVQGRDYRPGRMQRLQGSEVSGRGIREHLGVLRAGESTARVRRRPRSAVGDRKTNAITLAV